MTRHDLHFNNVEYASWMCVGTYRSLPNSTGKEPCICACQGPSFPYGLASSCTLALLDDSGAKPVWGRSPASIDGVRLPTRGWLRGWRRGGREEHGRISHGTVGGSRPWSEARGAAPTHARTDSPTPARFRARRRTFDARAHARTRSPARAGVTRLEPAEGRAVLPFAPPVTCRRRRNRRRRISSCRSKGGFAPFGPTVSAGGGPAADLPRAVRRWQG